ncbi:molybdenum cofactor guanylyltransferase [Sphingoaurantiacus capsulatus]|uniref:Molybdenum cofactor guanylyltransferase n=1 Tax=Sphingoaurantiacus capsulatus TaxID=1771310 RepID=A0ABV7XEB1_9SPHN
MKITALVLAGKRDGALDPLAAAADVSHKCLVPIAGRPLIAHVLDALDRSPEVERIIVSVDSVATLAGVPEAQRLLATGKLQVAEAQPNLVDSIIAALRDSAYPALVTTADNVLLTPAAVAELARQGFDADVLVAMARREEVLAAHPDGQRRFYRFRSGEYSNCNLYWLGSRKALDVAEVFRGGGQFAKHPARILAAFGVMNLLRFRFGWDSIGSMFVRLSRRFGLSLRPALMTDGALAIDVDNERTHAIAGELLLARQAKAGKSTGISDTSRIAAE